MIEKIIYLMIYLGTEIANYLLVYTVIFGAKITKKKSKIIVALISIFVIHLAIFYNIDDQVASTMSLLTMIMIPFLILDSPKLKYFIIYPFVIIGGSVIGVSASFLLAILWDVPLLQVITTSILGIVCQLLQGFVLVIMLLIQIKHKKSRKKIGNTNNQDLYEVNLNGKQYVVFYIVTICLFTMLGPIQELSMRFPEEKMINLAGAAASIGCIALVVVTLWQGIVVNREFKLKERNQFNEQYMRLQKEYCDELLKSDEKMRRFHHDMIAHVKALQSYCKENDNHALEGYLERMIEDSTLDNIKNYTGNRAVDAVMNHLINKAIEENISIETKGTIPKQSQVEDYDLCVIISNLLKNAIEECEKIKDKSQRKIVLEVGQFQSNLFITVKNTVNQKVKLVDGKLIPTKKDTYHHGFGSRNVEEAVYKYEGTIEYHNLQGLFLVEVTLQVYNK